METINKKAVVIFSGGLDSTTALYYALDKGYEVDALTFDYGQKHRTEIEHAKKIIALQNQIKHYIIPISTEIFSSSALTGNGLIPKDRKNIDESTIPVTYVPARNLIFLSIASAYAESNNAGNIFIGVNSQDYSGYPDCRNDFIESFENTLSLATKSGREGFPIHIQTPLASLDKKDIILLGKKLGVPYQYTWSCYDPVMNASGHYQPCMHCDSCRLRKKGFESAEISDPYIV